MDDKVREIFVESCLQQLANIEESILDLEHADGANLQEQVTRIFRAAHSIKGDAGSMGLETLSGYAHAIENVLQHLRDGALGLEQSLIDELLFAFDKLKTMIRSDDLGDGIDLHKEKQRLQHLLQTSASAPPEQADAATASDRSEQDLTQLAESFARENRIARVSIPAEQLDILVDRVGELAIVQTRLNRMARAEQDKKFLPVAEEIESLCALLRDQVLGLRMLPLGVSQAKYRRLVRDLCSDLGKKAEFSMRGQNTELDKKLIEELNTPLIHLLRNAVDHGIEPPSVRESLGKPTAGAVTVTASQSGGEVLIEIQDDGKGIDAEGLQRRAAAEGRIPPDKTLSRREQLDLIFLPGLSTAERVGEVSGRGVGMDAVKASITALRGKIEVFSEPGKGATFSIQLPVSMAIIDCLRVAVAGDDYFMHLDYVEECIELPLTVEQREQGAHSFALRGEHLPLICLRGFFRLQEERPQTMHIVVVRTNQGRFGVVVDHVVGQNQAVLRHLGPAVGKVEGILGATVTESGHMGLILDMPSLAQAALRDERQRWGELPGFQP
jgi:two-component system, chemotaxis family, sensor kinase CheA